MNSSQKFGLFILIAITVIYIYFAYFSKTFPLPNFSSTEQEEYTPVNVPPEENETTEVKPTTLKPLRSLKIFILDKNGNLRSVERTCDPNKEASCFEYAIEQLLAAPSKWEKSKGFSSEIPQGTKVISVRETSERIMIDLSNDFQSGGGTESTYYRIEQLIKTAQANTSTPVYLYINGQQANVIGGEGIIIKQPLNERSLDE